MKWVRNSSLSTAKPQQMVSTKFITGKSPISLDLTHTNHSLRQHLRRQYPDNKSRFGPQLKNHGALCLRGWRWCFWRHQFLHWKTLHWKVHFYFLAALKSWHLVLTPTRESFTTSPPHWVTPILFIGLWHQGLQLQSQRCNHTAGKRNSPEQSVPKKADSLQDFNITSIRRHMKP